jgi:hypothetical protein
MTDLIHKHKGLSSPCGWAIPLCGRWLWPLGHWRLVSARGPPRVLGAMTGYITTAATVTQESHHTPRSALVFEAHNNRLHRRTPVTASAASREMNATMSLRNSVPNSLAARSGSSSYICAISGSPTSDEFISQVAPRHTSVGASSLAKYLA